MSILFILFLSSQALERMKSTDGIELPHAWKGKLEDLAAKSREAMVNICIFESLFNVFLKGLSVCLSMYQVSMFSMNLMQNINNSLFALQDRPNLNASSNEVDACVSI